MTDMQSADTTSSQGPHPDPAEPATTYRYDAVLAAEIESRWQDRWEREGTFEAPNPSGPLGDPDRVAARPK
jgi:leucyl-tRNA synthetase